MANVIFVPLMAQVAWLYNIAITQLEKVQMLRKLKSRVTRVWRFQIYNLIIQIDNIFVDIRYSIV